MRHQVKRNKGREVGGEVRGCQVMEVLLHPDLRIMRSHSTALNKGTTSALPAFLGVHHCGTLGSKGPWCLLPTKFLGPRLKNPSK